MPRLREVQAALGRAQRGGGAAEAAGAAGRRLESLQSPGPRRSAADGEVGPSSDPFGGRNALVSSLFEDFQAVLL